MLYSYDIFDTILYRLVPKTTDIFVLMEEDIRDIWRKDFGEFSDIRKKTEFWVRRMSSKEITIEDIYYIIQKKTALSDECIRRLMDIELETEKRFSILNIPVLSEIKKRISNGDKVILISDMYWHEKQIRDWLIEKEELFRTIPIYISCDYGYTKTSGKLYELISAYEKYEYKNWQHTGDNQYSDKIVAEKYSIKALLVKGGRRYDFEERINIRNKSILKVYGIITESVANSNGDAFDMGASIVAPIVYQYTKWVVDQADKKKINTLYFVLRDGYILKQIADLIISRNKLHIKTAYIFGSRVAWRLPEITVEKLKNMSVWDKSNWVFRDPAFAYVPLERLGFNKQQVDSIFGIEFGKQVLLTFDDFKTMLDTCLQETEFINVLEQNIVNAQELLVSYLKQTIDFDESFALVDTNSTGKTQNDLNQLINKMYPGYEGLRFFYHTFLADKNPDSQTQFVFIDSKEDDKRLPEAFFRAPMNQCYGYKIEKGIVVPHFHESMKCAWDYSFDYDSYLEGIIEFVKRIENVNVDSYVDYLIKVVNFDIISKDEIRQAAKMPFNPDLNGDEILDFYPELTVDALFHPFSKLVYYPKGSYYNSGGLWIMIYSFLNGLVHIKRSMRKQK